MRQRVAVEEVWKEFGVELVLCGLFKEVEVVMPRVVEEGVAVGGEDVYC